MASQAFERRLLCAFLRGEWEPPSESWVFRENWLVWHRAVLPPKMLEAEFFGLTQEQALAVMTEATEQSEDTVRSILRRWGS